MAYITANAQIDFNTLDLNWFDRNWVSTNFYDNSYTELYLNTYEDLVVVDGDDGFDQLTLYFGGTGFVADGDGQFIAGTATAVIEYDTGSGSYNWRMEGISVPAASIQAAFLTASNADDFALLQLALSGNDEMHFSNFADSVYGYAGNDTIYGNGGNDTIDGGTGLDVIYGGEGNDSISGKGDADAIYGENGNDRLIGNAGDDTLNGGSGDDAMFGGGGNDVYYIDSSGDRAVEFAGLGFDEVRTTLAFTNAWSFNNQIEAITYIGTGDATINGATADNVLTAGSANSAAMHGFGGNDTLWGSNGHDELAGDNGDDELLGFYGNDTLYGGIGNDTLSGGADRDYLVGKGGNDVFLFADGDFSGTGPSNSDRIADFVQGQDLIDLSRVDAIQLGADDAFTFIGTAAFSNSAGQLRYEQTPSSTMIYGDTNGDGTADFAIKLMALYTLTDADFVL